MITKEQIQKLADMARISISEGEKESLRKDIDSILEYVGQIKEESYAVGELWEPAVRNIMREDVLLCQPGEYTDTLVKVAPKSEKGYVKVKKIF